MAIDLTQEELSGEDTLVAQAAPEATSSETVNVLGSEVTPGDLPPITQEDQRRIQLKGNQPLTESDQGIPPGRFETKVRGSVVGSSEVDLSIPENKQRMWEEERRWFQMKKGPERDALEDLLYQKYWGKTKEEVDAKKGSGFIYGGGTGSLYGDLGQHYKQVFQRLSAPGVGLADFAMDAVGNLPGLGFLDNSWDRSTRFDDGFAQGLRRLSSVVLPSMISSNYLAGKLPGITGGLAKPWQKWWAATGLWMAQESAIIGISDTGEGDNLPAVIADTFPGVFGPRGWLPMPSWYRTNPGDSVKVREYKNLLDVAGLSFFGSVLGLALKAKSGSKIMSWFEPLDEPSTNYKAAQVALNTDQAKLDRMYDINDILNTETLDRVTEKELINELEALKLSLDDVDDIESALDLIDSQRTEAQAIIAQMKDEINPGNQAYDPDKFPVGPENIRAIQTPEPGNVAKNMGDTTLIKTTGQEGNPVNMLSPNVIRKGLLLGPGASRNAVMGVAKEAEELGRFRYLAEGFRFSREQMSAAAWDIYESIIDVDSIPKLRDLFLDNRDVKNMLMGKFKVAYLNEEQTLAAAHAIKDLIDRFLGRKITESAARVMDTVGREVSSMSQAFIKLEEAIDEPRVMELIVDKLQFLLDEYALSKYISGWSLRNKNWADNILPENLEEAATALRKSFDIAEANIHAKNKQFGETIKQLANTNPLAIRPLMDAFVDSDGDVDTIAKLIKWADQKLTPMGLLKSPDPKEMNLFAKGTFSVVFNNLLSGPSAFAALLGNTGQLILRPINDIMGFAIWGGLEGDMAGLQKSLYYHGALYETNKRSLTHAWRAVKRGWENPDTLIENLTRKDFVLAKDAKSWQIIEDMEPLWRQNNDWGRIWQYNANKLIRDLGQWKYSRYGITGMAFPDAMATSHVGAVLSRVRAYDDVFSEFGFADWKKIKLAEKKHYSTFFDKDGNVTDTLLKQISGEIKLNLDDGVSNWLNQATTAYPITRHLFMFPRTQSNWVRNSLSWTPISVIPGINKYSKTIWAKTEADKAAALLEHGLDYYSLPNADAIWENLRAEYTGRIAFSTLMVKTLWDYAMGGNIRGNGHYNKSRRNKERTELRYEPKTIKFPVPGKDNDVWVTYKGIPGVEQVLSILGDMSYYAGDLDESMVENLQAKLMWTLSASFFQDTPFASLEWLVAAANGDLSGWNRGLANIAKAYAPASGLAGALRNSIDSAQKDIGGELHEYLMNRLPPFNFMLPNQTDFWTAKAINDVDHPVLKMFNAWSPIKIGPPLEPWRKALLEIGWPGASKLLKDSTGSYKYSPDQRQLVYKYMGEMEPWKELEKILKKKGYQKQIALLRSHRASGQGNEEDQIKLKRSLLPIFTEIDNMLARYQARAELRVLKENPEIPMGAAAQQIVDTAMKRGDVIKARTAQKKHIETKKLLNMRK